jgi:hypothetical protein
MPSTEAPGYADGRAFDPFPEQGGNSPGPNVACSFKCSAATSVARSRPRPPRARDAGHADRFPQQEPGRLREVIVRVLKPSPAPCRVGCVRALAHALAHRDEKACKARAAYGSRKPLSVIGGSRVRIPPPPLNQAVHLFDSARPRRCAVSKTAALSPSKSVDGCGSPLTASASGAQLAHRRRPPTKRHDDARSPTSGRQGRVPPNQLIRENSRQRVPESSRVRTPAQPRVPHGSGASLETGGAGGHATGLRRIGVTDAEWKNRPLHISRRSISARWGPRLVKLSPCFVQSHRGRSSGE